MPREIKKNRSPSTAFGDYACNMNNNGNVDYNGWDVTSSCGWSSPGTDVVGNACVVSNAGNVNYYYSSVYDDSFGRNHCPNKSQISLSVD